MRSAPWLRVVRAIRTSKCRPRSFSLENPRSLYILLKIFPDSSQFFSVAVLTAEKFQRQVWVRALKNAGVKYRKPYTTRHSFAAWALAIRSDQNRLVNLMGHASKQMIYEVYGRYVEGLEHDRLKILAYFGKDFKKG